MDPHRGRGAQENPANRFEALSFETDDDAWIDDDPRPLRTTFLRDDSQSILNRNTADDLSFDFSVNPYRGCEHGCSYCYARTYHEYLGFSAGLEFESKIVVKADAPALLERELARRKTSPGKIAMSGVTDCYQPVERKLQITRRCLEVLARFRQPVALITKNALVARDIDHLAELARHRAVCVYLSITTLDPALARILEPRASTPRARLAAMRALADAGIPVGPSAAPMIPGLNDHELPAILAAAKDAGATFAAYSMVRLPGAVAGIFESWLARHFPDRKEKILNRIRAAQGGGLNSTVPGTRMRGSGQAAGQLRALHHATCRRLGLATRPPDLSDQSFRKVLPGQGELF
ncbi:PA0069 family radical SAM protein [Luteolibacter flavescens]|uniref:PA0069 family radical SAM protein n=1 Tax=Luteolibacter flavescens TaxID=1859460 RepID=A0ABT3FX84_9BACT|nr:PA0069 family radical SAM protein [Luteolibacter flavescens]MCW1887856.1 PA0069 family radical SAM protein [Luteolibacter flavescens]